eukprot:6177594-Pleurochrysis_carterae.AAC.3
MPVSTPYHSTTMWMLISVVTSARNGRPSAQTALSAWRCMREGCGCWDMNAALQRFKSLRGSCNLIPRPMFNSGEVEMDAERSVLRQSQHPARDGD